MQTWGYHCTDGNVLCTFTREGFDSNQNQKTYLYIWFIISPETLTHTLYMLTFYTTLKLEKIYNVYMYCIWSIPGRRRLSYPHWDTAPSSGRTPSVTWTSTHHFVIATFAIRLWHGTLLLEAKLKEIKSLWTREQQGSDTRDCPIFRRKK